MSKKCKLVRDPKTIKFKVRIHNRCPICGRPRSYMRKFDMCRLCFRNRALKGELPGVLKASW
jgi:small subunit ribosomal protein S14